MRTKYTAATQKLIEQEGSARISLRQAAGAYADVAGDDDDAVWEPAWIRLREAALAYANATHEATRARAKESR